MEPNEAMKAMARRICARIIEGDSDNPLRVMKANRYLGGSLDDDHHMAIALAAIAETQACDAKLAEWAHLVPPDGGSPTEDEARLAASIASGIRSGEHYALAGDRHG